MERKNRIVVFGGTGYIGKHLVKASLSLGHPTFVYTRSLTSQTPPSKIQLCKDFTSMGVTLLQVTYILSSNNDSYNQIRSKNKGSSASPSFVQNKNEIIEIFFYFGVLLK